MIEDLDHVQLAMPSGREAEARIFYGELLGLTEIAKPEPLKARGGVWYKIGRRELHLGIEEPFRPAKKAHPGLRCVSLKALAERLVQAGCEVRWDDELPAVTRFYSHDPFGNRLEFLSPG